MNSTVRMQQIQRLMHISPTMIKYFLSRLHPLQFAARRRCLDFVILGAHVVQQSGIMLKEKKPKTLN